VSDSERTDSPNGPADRMTFLEHLDELRSRLIRAAIAIMVAFVACFFFYDEVFNFLMQPLRNVIEPYGGSLIATAPQENFVLGIKMSFLVAIVVSTPVWLGQVWGFIAPGLYRHERHLAVPFVIVGSVFFISGAVFCHYILFPIGAEFLSTFGGVGEDIEIRYRVSETFSFYARLVLVTAVMFQIPTLALLLSRLGVITPGFLVRYFKYAILLCFVFAALLTPPDPATQILLAGPMILLYTLSIGIAWVGNRMRGKGREDE
jgi:sec-independent protein translocase protein TatC